MIGEAVLPVTFLISHLSQLTRFADQFARRSGLAGSAGSESLSRLPFILPALPRGLTTVFFMNNFFSPHQAARVALQPAALRRGQPRAPNSQHRGPGTYPRSKRAPSFLHPSSVLHTLPLPPAPEAGASSLLQGSASSHPDSRA